MVKRNCDVCGKRMFWWQDTVMTTNKLGEVVIPINHTKCSDKMNGKVYRNKSNG